MDESNDFETWLAEATLTQASAEVLQDGRLLAKWEDLRTRWDRAEKIPAADRGISDPDPMAELELEARALLDAIEGSRTTFVVRGLLPSDLAAIQAAHPVTKAPEFVGKKPAIVQSPTDAQAKAFLGMWESYQLQKAEWERVHADEIETHRNATVAALRAQGAERVSRAVVRVEQAGRIIATKLTPEQVLSLADSIGEPQLQLILDAITRASDNAPEVDPDFLSRNSGSGQP